MRKILAVMVVMMALAALPQEASAQATQPFLKVDATSTPQFMILNGEGPASNDDILRGSQFYSVIIKNNDTEECVHSLWKLTVSGTDTTWVMNGTWTAVGDTVGTLQPGDGAYYLLNDADAIYLSSGLVTVVRQ